MWLWLNCWSALKLYIVFPACGLMQCQIRHDPQWAFKFDLGVCKDHQISEIHIKKNLKNWWLPNQEISRFFSAISRFFPGFSGWVSFVFFEQNVETLGFSLCGPLTLHGFAWEFPLNTWFCVYFRRALITCIRLASEDHRDSSADLGNCRWYR